MTVCVLGNDGSIRAGIAHTHCHGAGTSNPKLSPGGIEPESPDWESSTLPPYQDDWVKVDARKQLFPCNVINRGSLTDSILPTPGHCSQLPVLLVGASASDPEGRLHDWCPLNLVFSHRTSTMRWFSGNPGSSLKFEHSGDGPSDWIVQR